MSRSTKPYSDQQIYKTVQRSADLQNSTAISTKSYSDQQIYKTAQRSVDLQNYTAISTKPHSDQHKAAQRSAQSRTPISRSTKPSTEISTKLHIDEQIYKTVQRSADLQNRTAISIRTKLYSDQQMYKRAQRSAVNCTPSLARSVVGSPESQRKDQKRHGQQETNT